MPTVCAPQQKKLAQWEACAWKQKEHLLAQQLQEAYAQQERLSTIENK